VKELLTKEKYLEAIRYIDTLRLHRHFEILPLLKSLVSKERIPEAKLLVNNSSDRDKKVFFVVMSLGPHPDHVHQQKRVKRRRLPEALKVQNRRVPGAVQTAAEAAYPVHLQIVDLGQG
jgi:hypothetical protein